MDNRGMMNGNAVHDVDDDPPPSYSSIMLNPATAVPPGSESNTIATQTTPKSAIVTPNDIIPTLYNYIDEKLKVIIPTDSGADPATATNATAATTLHPNALRANPTTTTATHTHPEYSPSQYHSRPFCSETFYKFLYILLCTMSFVLAISLFFIFKVKFKFY